MRRAPAVYATTILLLLLLPLMHAAAQGSPSGMGSPEGARTYGDPGTLEIGASGSVGTANMSGTILVNGATQASYPTTTFLTNLSVFTKYFLLSGVHVGGSLQAQANLQYDESSTLVGGSGNVGVFAQAGYTLRLTPMVQLDLTGGLGEMAEFYQSFTPFWCFTVMAQPMLLFPIGQNAVLGIGSLIMAMFIDGSIPDFMETDTLKINATALSANGVIQMSIYF